MLNREIESDLKAMSTDEIRFRVGVLRSNGADRLAGQIEKWVQRNRRAVPLTDAEDTQ